MLAVGVHHDFRQRLGLVTRLRGDPDFVQDLLRAHVQDHGFGHLPDAGRFVDDTRLDPMPCQFVGKREANRPPLPGRERRCRKPSCTPFAIGYVFGNRLGFGVARWGTQSPGGERPCTRAVSCEGEKAARDRDVFHEVRRLRGVGKARVKNSGSQNRERGHRHSNGGCCDPHHKE